MPSVFKFADDVLRRMHWYHIAALKISMIAFGLLLAKLYAPILLLDWYWYAILFAVPALWLIAVMLKK